MDANYYKDYYILERSHWWFTVRKNILRETIARNKSLLDATGRLKILNVGIATGATTQMLSEFGEVTSVEYDKACCEFLRNDLKMEVVQASATELPFESNQFDIVCCYDVIEHIEEDSTAAKEITRVCKENGLIHVTVPAFQFLWSDHDVINHHFRRYTMDQLLGVFPNQNLQKIYKTYFNSILFLPISIFRGAANGLRALFPKKNRVVKSDFSNFKDQSFINKVFYFIFNLERKLLQVGLSFRLGLSIQVLFKKLPQ